MPTDGRFFDILRPDIERIAIITRERHHEMIHQRALYEGDVRGCWICYPPPPPTRWQRVRTWLRYTPCSWWRRYGLHVHFGPCETDEW